MLFLFRKTSEECIVPVCVLWQFKHFPPSPEKQWSDLQCGTAGPSATTNEAANTADLEEVKLDEYWTAVETLSAEDQVLVMDFYTQ